MKQITEIHCSALSRPMTCAGSLFFEGLPVQETNEAAKEGTAFGELVERLLTNQDIPGAAKNGVAFNEEMHFHAKDIANEILSNCEGEVSCEQPIDWVTRSGICIKGRPDETFIRDGKLFIDDNKYGWNIVEVRENWQLLGYAIGEVIRRRTAFPSIVLRIHQPRPHHEDGPTRDWEITYDELIAYKEQIETRMDQIASGFAELVTSSKCKYCPAAASACTAFSRSVYSGVDHILSEFKQDSLSEKEVSYQLELMDRISDIFKIKHDSLKQLALSMIKDGKLIPGYVAEDSLGDRQWKKEVSPDVIKTLCGIDIVEKSMLSPAKAEKMGVPKDLVKMYVDRFFKGQKLTRKDTSKLGNQIFGSQQPKGVL